MKVNYAEHALLDVNRITGGYSMNRPVLHDVSFQIKAGEIVALIGLNGAGKSTTMKHLLGLLHPQTGRVSIKGSTLQENPEMYRASYAYVPESPMLFEELTVKEHLEMTAMAYGLDKETFAVRSRHLLQIFHMQEKEDQFSQHLSKGMRQKVMIMSAFLAQPDLYIIDEPFLGLDPLGIRAVLQWMEKAKQEGAGILMSSHILSMIEQYCDRFIILHQGKVMAQGELSLLQKLSALPGAGLEEIFYSLIQSGPEV